MLQESQNMTVSGTTPYDPNDTTPWEPLDENLFREELTALIPHLRAFARSLCGNHALADDVAQDAMLKAWKARLKDDQREALILVGASGLSYEEAAEICGCAVGTIKSRVSRARKALEVIMENADFDTEADNISALDAMNEILNEAKDLAEN